MLQASIARGIPTRWRAHEPVHPSDDPTADLWHEFPSDVLASSGLGHGQATAILAKYRQSGYQSFRSEVRDREVRRNPQVFEV